MTNVKSNDRSWRMPSNCDTIFLDTTHFGNCFKHVIFLRSGDPNVQL